MATQKPGGILGGVTKTAPAADPNQPDQENKALENEVPVNQIVDPENVNQQEGGEGEHGTNTPNPTNEVGRLDKDPATDLVVPTSKNAYEADPNLGQGAGEVGTAGDAEAEQAALEAAQTAEARRIADENRAAVAERRKQRRFTPPTEEELSNESQSVQEPEIVAAYKHTSVRHFKVGPFEFQNHILYITSDEANEEFLDAYDGLPDRDRNAIVQYDWKAAARVEQPVNRASRGSMSTRDIKDSKVIGR